MKLKNYLCFFSIVWTSFFHTRLIPFVRIKRQTPKPIKIRLMWFVKFARPEKHTPIEKTRADEIRQRGSVLFKK